MSFPALVIALALLLYVAVSAEAGRTRHRHDVKPNFRTLGGWAA
jgi:hypothetical protein